MKPFYNELRMMYNSCNKESMKGLNMSNYILIIFLIFAMVGCAPVQNTYTQSDHTVVYNQIKAYAKTIIKDTKHYKAGKTSTVYVGEPVLRETFQKTKVVYLDSRSGIPICKATKFLPSFIDKGKNYIVYSYDKRNPDYQYVYLGEKNYGYNIKVYIKVNSNGNLVDTGIYNVFGNQIASNVLLGLDGKVCKIFKPTSDVVIDEYPIDKSFTVELLYMGLLNNNIKLVYREFVGDMIRPAFTQEVFYPFSQGSIIRFKKYKIKILKANNQLIKYKIMK